MHIYVSNLTSDWLIFTANPGIIYDDKVVNIIFSPIEGLGRCLARTRAFRGNVTLLKPDTLPDVYQ